MTETRVVLTSPVPRQYRREIERRLLYVHADITGFELVERDGEVGEIVVHSGGGIGADELAHKISVLIDKEIHGRRAVPEKRIWNARPHGLAHPAVFDRLVEAGLAVELGEGQVAIGQPLMALMDALDDRLVALVRRHFGATEFRYPTLIPSAVLDRCGYFPSFPQYMMFVTRLHADIDVYNAFVENYAARGRLDDSILESCRNVDYCLPPTMCFHTYGQFAGTGLAPGERRVVTSRGKSFRYESRYHRSLERLWDFTIREIVFMGERESVLAARQEFMLLTFDLVDQLELAGHCEVGNDPFFCTDDSAHKAWSQRLLELKYELQLEVEAGRTIAAASFNFHDDFFGSSFGITQGEGFVHTACVGFGLERLLYAFLCRHGLDSRQWPSGLAVVGDLEVVHAGE